MGALVFLRALFFSIPEQRAESREQSTEYRDEAHGGLLIVWFSRTSRLPVLYVLGRKPIDVEHLTKELQRFFPLKDGHIQNLEEEEVVGLHIIGHFLILAQANPLFLPSSSCHAPTGSPPAGGTLRRALCSRHAPVGEQDSRAGIHCQSSGSESNQTIPCS